MMKKDRASITRGHDGRPAWARRGGFTLVELAIALFVFGMLIILFGATFPVATRGSHVGSNYAQASLLAQHKIDQLRDAGFAGLNSAKLANMGVIDSSTQNADGSYSFTTSDNLLSFYPNGSTGKIWLGTVPTTAQFPSPPPISRAVLVTVTIQWQGGSQTSGNFTTHTVIGSP